MYYPKRPIRSFQDLEVYQKLLTISVAVAKRVIANEVKQSLEIATSPTAPRNDIQGKLVETALDLPIKIAYAHSIRFTPGVMALNKLEETMLNSNLTIVSLEQYRDICNNGIEVEFFDEQIKNLHLIRHKVLYLQRSWKKFMKGNSA